VFPLALWVELGAALALLVGRLSLLSPLLRLLLLLLLLVRWPIHNPTPKEMTTGALVEEVVQVGVGWLLYGEMATTLRGLVRVSSFAMFYFPSTGYCVCVCFF